MTKPLILKFDIRSDWHIGDGLDAGAYADAITLKDASGLPYLPGKSVKGLLREAFMLASENAWITRDSVDVLFGIEGDQGKSQQGLIEVSSATLPLGESTFISQSPGMKSKLYRVVSSTAIDHRSGVAKNTSLRSTEVTIPVTLYSEVTLRATENTQDSKAAKDLADVIEQVCSLIFDLGAKRHRGFGDVIVSISDQKEAAA